jgi:hypothetical protein
MSLGWQTESALLPSKAKPIAVDGKSLLSLKAVVFDQEKKVTSSRSNQDEKYLKHRSSNSSKAKDPMLGSNKGIETRQNKDAQLRLKEEKSESVVEASLKAKAKLYDEIASRKTLANSTSSSFLVNFQEKEHIRLVDEVTETNHRSHDASNENEEMVEIVDSFGRSRRVSKRSAEYSEYYLDRSAKKYKSSLMSQASHAAYETASSNSSSATTGQWAWSTGHDRKDAGEWIDEAVRERGLKALIEDRVNHEVNESLGMSKGARVKTMWEKTLDSSAREYIDEIHNQVQSHRNQQHDSTEKSSCKLDPISEMSEADKRRELIRRKLEARKAREAS